MFVRFLGNPVIIAPALKKTYITSMIAKFIKEGPIKLTTFGLLHECTDLIKSMFFEEEVEERQNALKWLHQVIKENPVNKKVYDIYIYMYTYYIFRFCFV